MSATKNGDKKRKAGIRDDDVEVGARINSLFEDEEWYGGRVTMIRRDKGGDVVKVGILYDDGDEEECSWPDGNIIVDNSEDAEEKDNDKKKRKRIKDDAIGGEC